MTEKNEKGGKPDQPASVKLTVSEWLQKKFPGTTTANGFRPHGDAWKHAAAAALHCWAEHAHHAGEEMQLSEADYDAACESACKVDPKTRDYKPHGPALSKHAPTKDTKKG